MIEKYEEALEVSNKVIAMNPNNQSVLSVAYSNKGYALVWLKKPKEALEACNKSLELSGDNLDAHIAISLAHSSLGNYEEAVNWCDKAIKIDPNAVEPYINKSNYLVNLGKSKEALECCSKASELNVPQNPVYESIILTNNQRR